MDITTNYLGMKLKSPIVPSAGPLSTEIGNLKQMEDAGAGETMIFSDFGIVATTEANGPALTRSLLTGLAASQPDVIVLELGDGLLGAYGVEAILSDKAIRDALTAVVLCANDPVSAWGGAKILRKDFDI